MGLGCAAVGHGRLANHVFHYPISPRLVHRLELMNPYLPRPGVDKRSHRKWLSCLGLWGRGRLSVGVAAGLAASREGQ